MNRNLSLNRGLAVAGAAVVAACAFSASHSDAPLMVLDPSANITDVYSFVRNNSQGVKMLNIIMTVNPLEDPGNGVIFDRFADDVRYSIHIAKQKKVNGQFVFDGKVSTSYHFRFSNSYKNGNTILSYGLGTNAGPIGTTGDAQQNFLQTYSVEREVGNSRTNLSASLTLMVPPVNVGPRTTPGYYDAMGNRLQGAAAVGQQPSYVQETIYNLANGIRVWAGQREDGFYADTPGIFDFLGVRNPGKDGFSGYNLHAIAMQIPVSQIIGAGDSSTVGVFATTARRALEVRRSLNSTKSPGGPPGSGSSGSGSLGDWVQVSRMGNPLFNEVLVALADKDRYNGTSPVLDSSLYKKYAEKCELAFLLNAVFGTNFVVDGRTDLVGIFIPDLLKVDLSTGPVPLAGDEAFSRLSFIGGDTVMNGSGASVPAGWPNGRRFGDDVVDIALTAVASGPAYTTITPLGDNVSANDTQYDAVFPYAGTPWGGPGTTLH